jgi:hypothetical protein
MGERVVSWHRRGDPILCDRRSGRHGHAVRRRAFAGVAPQLLGARIYDVAVGCMLALAGTVAASYPRRARDNR